MAAVSAAALLAGGGAGYAIGQHAPQERPLPPAQPAATVQPVSGLASGFAVDPQRGVVTIAPLLETATQAVVNISVQSKAPLADNPLFQDPFFRRFFELPDQPPEQRRLSAGSGVIVDADKGYILTNHHVVDNAEEILVTLKDQRRIKAKLIGSDAGTDIALVQVEAKNLAELPVANSSDVKVGDFVVAIGNPFGLGQTVTSGIVSATGRGGLSSESYEDFIQTDAPINPGNSGGALINTKGELVGINSAIITPGGGNVGIGFSVPANMAKSVMDQLIRYGEVHRGRIGVIVQDVTPDLAEALRLSATHGAVVSQVEDGSAAEKAGIKAGDVIVAVDGDDIAGSSELRNKVGLTETGRSVDLTVLRDGARKTMTVKIEKAKVAEAASESALPQLAGAQLSDAPGKEGVVVKEVERGSAAWLAGLRKDDVIREVNRATVRNLSELRSAARDASGSLALTVQRGSLQIFLVIR